MDEILRIRYIAKCGTHLAVIICMNGKVANHGLGPQCMGMCHGSYLHPLFMNKHHYLTSNEINASDLQCRMVVWCRGTVGIAIAHYLFSTFILGYELFR